MIFIRPLSKNDFDAWHSLWLAYIKFYKETISEDVTSATWRRLMDDNILMMGDVVEFDGRVVGFSNSVIHEATWTDKPVCYLEDLYVDQDVRSKGCGRALINNLIKRSKEKGWSRLYWHTNENNDRARVLYDSYKLAENDVRYRLLFDN